MRRCGAVFALTLTLTLGACATEGTEETAPVAGRAPIALPAPAPAPTATPAAFDPAELRFAGQLEQGGWVRGTAPRGTAKLTLGDQQVAIASDGSFFAGFDRDAPARLDLVATAADGRRATRNLAIAPRAWRIERVNAPLRGNVPSEVFMAKRRPELEAIAAARAMRSDTGGWRQAFVWPASGRISGLFGSQRIYRGTPAAYHSGLDIAAGAGATYVAPADGVVVLAADTPFTLEGHLLIVDHGMGLHSAFLHASRLAVKRGDTVRQGQVLGYVGATGRATGPHLHWSLTWQGERLDPLLFLPPR